MSTAAPERGFESRTKGSPTMTMRYFKFVVPGIFAVAALALAVGAGAQTPPPAGAPPAGTPPHAAPLPGHPVDSAAAAEHEADMKAECQAMMARKQERQDELAAMDATLDKLVAEMNAAKESREADALEKAMAAVLDELVAQRKVRHSMMMEMQPGMMAHMMHHMHMRGMHGSMDCPMMKTGQAAETKAEEAKPQM